VLKNIPPQNQAPQPGNTILYMFLLLLQGSLFLTRIPLIE